MNCETEDLFGSYPPYVETTACSFSLIGDDSRMIIIKFSSNYFYHFQYNTRHVNSHHDESFVYNFLLKF